MQKANQCVNLGMVKSPGWARKGMSKNKKEEITSDLEEFEEDENEEKTKLNSVETKIVVCQRN